MWKLRWYKKRVTEKIAMFIAWNLVPKEIAKWVLVRLAVKATGNDESPCDCTYEKMYKAI